MSATMAAGVTWRAGWLRGPTHDIAMALLWLPFAVVAYAVVDDPDRLRRLVSATLVFSFAHQPLTLWLVYGDGPQRRAYRHVFAWAPPVVLIAVVVGTSLRPDVVALVAGTWNVAHTLRQRYGVSRLYGRLAGIDCAGDNRLLWSWLAVAVVVGLAGTDLGVAAREAGLGGRNTAAIDALASVHVIGAVLVPSVLAVAAVVTATWARVERRRSAHNPARLVYLSSTAVLLVVLAVEPVIGFVGYVGAHAAEYLLVVRWRIGRAAERATVGDRVGAVARRIGSDGTIAVYAAVVVTLIFGLRRFDGGDVAGAIALSLGGLHLLFDGFIWRSPRPAANKAAVGTKTSTDDLRPRRRSVRAAPGAVPVAT
jgi:hypothetical protein